MTKRIYFFLILAGLAGSPLFFFLSLPIEGYVASAIGLVALILYHRSVTLPLKTINLGLNLLKSHDYASTIRKVGHRETDDIVAFYNSLINSIKTERLHNLEQQDFLGKVLERSPMGIAICDLDGNIERTNPSFDKMASPEVMKVLRSLPEGKSTVLEAGSSEIIRCSRAYFMDRGFRRSFYMTELLTDEIRSAQKDLYSKIIRIISHEVKNNLGGVTSVLETLSVVNGDDHQIVATLCSCIESCRALERFLTRWSEPVKLHQADRRPVALKEIVDNSEPFLKKLCPSNISLTIDTCDDTLIIADSDLIQRVIINAVKNAVDSIGSRDGSVTIYCRNNRLEIIDNGPGISPENAKRIFTPLFSTKRPDRGLGLMLVSDILRMHKAAYSLTTSPDDGLTRLSVQF